MSGQGGGSRFNEFARLWSAAGHEVTVVAGTVDYNTSKKPERYRARWVVSEPDGRVRVFRCYVSEQYGKSYLGRAWAFFVFALSAMTAVFRVGPHDVVIATSPPLIVALPGWFASRWLRARLVFEVRDLWPESAITTGVMKRDSLFARLLYRMESWICRSADRVNVLTPAFREDLIKRNLVFEGNLLFVPNGADLHTFRPGPRNTSAREEFGWADRFVVLYAGAHGRANALKQLIEAADLLKDRPDIFIACVGDGPERRSLETAVHNRGLTNIRFYGPQPKSKMADLVSACDVGAAVLQNNPTFQTVYPNKVFDYMACERPVLLAIDGVARRLVCQEANAGIFAEPENPVSIAEAILRLADSPQASADLGKNGRAWVVANASRDSLAARYLTHLEALTASPLAGYRVKPLQAALKRLFDFSFAAIGMVVLAPVFAIVSLAIRATMGAPVFFRQDRIGYGQGPFCLVKFRTMSDKRDQNGQLLPDTDRLAGAGRWIRKLSLDELPQLWNVLKGEMSLVGPRPLFKKYLPLYTPQQRRRHDVKPGITGLAQVYGRNAISWEKKFEYDLQYVNEANLWLDLRILARTVQQVLFARGITQEGHVTMPEFIGARYDHQETLQA